jgi:Tol biopolymer transport system component
MRITRSLLLLAGAVALAASLPLACGGSGDNGKTTGTGGHAATSTTTGSNNGGFGGSFLSTGGGTGAPVVSITIAPTAPVLEVLNGVVPAPITFTATGKTQTGDMVQLSGQWDYDRPDVADLNAGTGVFTPTGLVGAVGNVTFTYGALSAKTTATVKLHYTSDPQMVPAPVKMAFAQATMNDPAMALLYPYDKTVFPRGLTGPTLQWNGGGASDIYYVHALSPSFEFEGWGTVPPPSRYTFPTMPDDIWKKLTDSTTGNISLSIQRYDGTQAYMPSSESWTIAPANLTGTIYYWAINAGSVVRLQPGAGMASSFLQLPGGVGCVACHSVSKNGSTIVASFNGGMSPWGTFDAASGSSLFNSGQNSGFEAISPDGKFVLWGQWDDNSFDSTGFLTLSDFNDASNLAQLNPGGGFPSHPAWSSDAKHVAFAMRTDGTSLDFNTSTLWTTDVDLGAHTFSNTHMIVPNASPQTATVYPTYSPDSKWIAFERCTHSRSRGNQGDVWLVAADGSNPVQLDLADGTGKLTGNEASSTYEPTFMPVAVGGYFWLIVVSERTYGNTLTDTALGSRTKQLWVTAIDATPTPGQDPSHPPFWLPGQDLGTNNMRGEWALSPCQMIGQSCTAGYDCCSGFCVSDGMGNFTCSDKSSGCSHIGDACTTNADCCDSTDVCVGGFCSLSTPQ